MTHRANRQSGFTLIELLLALAFVAFVLIFATTTIIQVMRTYNKGLAVKEINQTARAAMEDMSRIIKVSNPNAIASLARTAPNITGPTANQGRVCFGGVSYVWNFTNLTTNRYTDGSRVNFARVNDPGSSLCVGAPGSYPNVNRAQATELLSGNVWVQQLTVVPGVANAFYDIYIQLSTVDDPANPAIVTAWTDPTPDLRVVCRGGNTGQFCAVAGFTTSVNARGGTK
jgi:prepilin-type N-terminal cleavage/methylation domain-containing protein